MLQDRSRMMQMSVLSGEIVYQTIKPCGQEARHAALYTDLSSALRLGREGSQ